MAGGWLTLMSSSGEPFQVGRRAPDGTVTMLGVGTGGRALASSGTMLFNGPQNLSVLRPDGSVVGNLSGTRGSFRFVGDELYALLGRTLFRVSY